MFSAMNGSDIDPGGYGDRDSIHHEDDDDDDMAGFTFARPAQVAGRFSGFQRNNISYGDNLSSSGSKSPAQSEAGSVRGSARASVEQKKTPERVLASPVDLTGDVHEASFERMSENQHLGTPKNDPVVKEHPVGSSPSARHPEVIGRPVNPSPSQPQKHAPSMRMPFPDIKRSSVVSGRPQKAPSVHRQDKPVALGHISPAFKVYKPTARLSTPTPVPHGISPLGDLELPTKRESSRAVPRVSPERKMISKIAKVSKLSGRPKATVDDGRDRAYRRTSSGSNDTSGRGSSRTKNTGNSLSAKRLVEHEKAGGSHKSEIPERPSSRTSNISRRRLRLKDDWLAVAADDTQLVDVASTLNSWYEYNRTSRAKATKLMRSFEEKIEHLKKQVEERDVKISDHQAIYIELENDKVRSDLANEELASKLEELQSQMEQQEGIIESSVAFQEDLERRLEGVLKVYGENGSEGGCERMIDRIKEKIEKTESRLSEAEHSLEDMERERVALEKEFAGKIREMEATGSRDQNFIATLEEKLQNKSDEALSASCRVAELEQKVQDLESMASRDSSLEVQFEKLMAAVEENKAGKGLDVDVQEFMASKFEMLLDSIQNQTRQAERDVAVHERLDSIEAAQKAGQTSIVSSIAELVSQDAHTKGLSLGAEIKDLVENQTTNIVELLQEQRCRLSDVISQADRCDKLADQVDSLHKLLSDSQAEHAKLQQELATKTAKLESATERADEAAELKAANGALQERLDELQSQRVSDLQSDNAKMADLRLQIQEVSTQYQAAKVELSVNVKECEELRLSLSKQETLLAEAKAAVSTQAKSGADPEDSLESLQAKVKEKDAAIVAARAETAEANQRVINLRERLKKAESFTAELGQTLGAWRKHSERVGQLQSKMSDTGVSQVQEMCAQLSSLWGERPERWSVRQTTENDPPCTPPGNKHRGPDIQDTKDWGDGEVFAGDGVFDDVDIDDIIDTMETMQSPGEIRRNESVVKSPVIQRSRTISDNSTASVPGQNRRLVFQLPESTQEPQVPTVQEEQAARREAPPPTSIMRSKLVEQPVSSSVSPSEASKCAETAKKLRQLQLRESLSQRGARVVAGSAVITRSLTAHDGARDDIRRSLGIEVTGQAGIEASKRKRVDSASGPGKGAKARLTENGRTSIHMQSEYFRQSSRTMSTRRNAADDVEVVED